MERISEAEQAVLEILWEAGSLSSQDIADRLAKTRGWSGSTVKTLLARLVQKRAVDHVSEGRRFLYTATLGRDAYSATVSRQMIDRLFGGRITGLVAQFAEQEALSPQDIDEIEQLLRELRR